MTKWTPEEEELLRRNWLNSQTRTLRDMMFLHTNIYRSENSIIGKANKMKLPAKKPAQRGNNDPERPRLHG